MSSVQYFPRHAHSAPRHTWRIDDSYFLRQAEHQWPGMDLDVAGVEPAREPDSSQPG